MHVRAKNRTSVSYHDKSTSARILFNVTFQIAIKYIFVYEHLKKRELRICARLFLLKRILKKHIQHNMFVADPKKHHVLPSVRVASSEFDDIPSSHRFVS